MLNVSGMFLRVYLFVEGRGSRVEGSMSRVDRKNLKNKWRVDISIHISSTCWVGRRKGEGRGKGEGSLLLSEFECPRTILIKEQQQHIFFIKKLKKKLPSTWYPRPSTLACVAGGIVWVRD